MVTPDINNVLIELRNVKDNCEKIVNNIDHYKENITKSTKLLAELDPVFKKEQATESRFSKLEDMMAKLTKSQIESNNKIDELIDKLK